MTKNRDNPISNRPQKQMSKEDISRFVLNVYGPRGFAERVVFGHKIDHYGNQIHAYIERQASEFPNLAEGRRWKKKTLEKMTRFEGGVNGYGWDESRGAVYITTDYRSGRLSATPAFSGTIATVSRIKMILGYMIVMLLIGFTLWLGWEVSKGIRTGFLTLENYGEQLMDYYNLE